MISGSTKLLGVLGHNISYSLSPMIHNFSAKKMAIDSIYVPFDLGPSHVENFLKVFWELGGQGLNVTTPYKELVAQLTNQEDMRAVNTVYRSDSGWQSTSTDAAGLEVAIQRLALSFWAFKRILILGSGGVVRSIVEHFASRMEQSREVLVFRRNPKRDGDFKNLPEGFNLKFLDFDPGLFADALVGSSGETLVIQATSGPHHGDRLERFSEPMKRFNGAFVDLCYGKTSAMLSAAQQRGVPCQDGLPMLVEQARLSQRNWWGKSASYEDIFEFLAKNM